MRIWILGKLLLDELLLHLKAVVHLLSGVPKYRLIDALVHRVIHILFRILSAFLLHDNAFLPTPSWGKCLASNVSWGLEVRHRPAYV